MYGAVIPHKRGNTMSLNLAPGGAKARSVVESGEANQAQPTVRHGKQSDHSRQVDTQSLSLWRATDASSVTVTSQLSRERISGHTHRTDGAVAAMGSHE